MPETKELQDRAINTIRFLSADAVQAANSGHPGLPMGAAAMAYTLFTRHLRFNPKNPRWEGRDRFILSGGHGSMLLYSMLHLTGYDLPLEELRRFRQLGSITPGHPESFLTPGVEVTTGPLGQGFGSAVGIGIGLKHLGALFNRPGHELYDQKVYAIVTDGDLMEGVAAEAASLAGHLRLDNLIFLYDDNRISIEGSTDLAFTEDRALRFEAYGWQVLRVKDGNDVDALDQAIGRAKQADRPVLIVCRTQIGYGLPNRQGTAKAHGEAPGEEELAAARQRLDWPAEPRFFIPDDVLAYYRQAVERGAGLEQAWQQRVQAYRQAFPEQGALLDRLLLGELPENWHASLPNFPADAKGLATRQASGKTLNAIAGVLPELIGGSADLAPSTNTIIDGGGHFQAGSYEGRNLHFGVREHGMGAIVNGLASIPGLRPYGATFLVFSDYMRGAIRISALSHLPSIWIFTHDSIGLGEDGPTHQPVEHLMALRAMPNLVVLRPGDANETAQCWKIAVERKAGPVTLVLTRQALPTLDREGQGMAPAEAVAKGAYVLADLGEGAGEPDLILIASGSEVSLIVEASRRLAEQGLRVRLVSFPSWELFAEQSPEYRASVFPPGVRARLAVEAGATLGWERWVGSQGAVIGLDRFGVSAPYKDAFRELGFTVDNVMEQAQRLLKRERK